jgi:hypothetical protein
MPAKYLYEFLRHEEIYPDAVKFIGIGEPIADSPVSSE